MSRIRTIKPDLWVSEQIGDCTPLARLTFIGMWNFCDDNGVHPAKPKTLKAELYPMDSFTPAEVQGWVQELVAARLVGEFERDGARYWYVTGWAKHQRIDRPSAKYPPPPGLASESPRGAVAESAATAREESTSASEDSANARRAPPPGMEGKGEEGKLSDEADASSSSPGATRKRRKGNVSMVPCPYDAIVAAYHQALPALPSVRLMPVARQKAMRKAWGWVLSSSRPDGTRRAITAEEALQWFRDYFDRASHNDFLMGRTPRSGEHSNWQCDIDFLLTDKGMKFVIEKTQEAA